MGNGMQAGDPVPATGRQGTAGPAGPAPLDGPPDAAVWSVRAQGDIDIDHAEALAAQLDEVVARGARVVLLDLRKASFLDSSGLRVIARAGERLATEDGQLIIEGASGAVSRVLELTGLLERYGAARDRSD